jgi:hypothetical protein
MNRSRYVIVALTLAIGVGVASAASTPAPVRTEIEALLGRLEASGCEFNRNGTWYKSTEAKTHLLRKLEYIEGRTTLKNTEQFIEIVASSSSSSGKAYQVRCQGATPTLSAQWLKVELEALRTAGKK